MSKGRPVRPKGKELYVAALVVDATVLVAYSESSLSNMGVSTAPLGEDC